MKDEKLIWAGSPSQLLNFGYYILCLILVFFVIGIFLGVWKFFQTKLHHFEITDQRIIEYKGVFTRRTDELELFRVKDIKLVQPFFLRIFGLSNLYLVSSDKSHPTILIPGIPDGMNLKEKVRSFVESRRDVKRVRETDFI